MKKTAQQEKLEEGSKKAAPAESKELKTDYPLSEKDEIKQAEDKMRKSRRKIL